MRLSQVRSSNAPHIPPHFHYIIQINQPNSFREAHEESWPGSRSCGNCNGRERFPRKLTRPVVRMARTAAASALLVLVCLLAGCIAEDVAVSADGLQSSSSSAATDAAGQASELEQLRARVAELEAEKRGLVRMYAEVKDKYEKGCPYCPPTRPPETIDPSTASHAKLRDEIDQLLNAERDRQVSVLD